MEILSLLEPWAKEARLDTEPIEKVYEEDLMFFDFLESLIKHRVEFLCTPTDSGYSVCTVSKGVELQLNFDKDDHLISRQSRILNS